MYTIILVYDRVKGYKLKTLYVKIKEIKTRCVMSSLRMNKILTQSSSYPSLRKLN